MVPKWLIIFLVVVVSILLIGWTVSKENFQTEEKAWFEKANEQFFERFQRPIDLIHSSYFDFHCKEKTTQKSIEWITKDLEIYNTQVRIGTEKSKNSSIIIAGLIRNAAYQIPKLKERCASITKLFKEYKIIFVENNSTDGTREFLLDWVKEDPNVIILCQDIFAVNQTECDISNLFPKSENLGASPLPDRIQKMAFLRNTYLKHVQQYYSHFDYFCVMDMDLKGDLFIDGFKHSLGMLETNPKLDAVACNGMLMNSTNDYYYYDSFAHIEWGDPFVWENQTAKSNHDRYVHSYITVKYTNNMSPDKVRSAFGGIVLYKMSKIQNRLYDFSSVFFSCEHSYFHKNMSMVVNPRFIFLISQNGM